MPLDLKAALPGPGEEMFAGKDWLHSPEPFPISRKLLGQIERLGHRLHLFQKACQAFYQRSLTGKLPRWIAAYLDAGKPPELLESARHKALRDVLPGVIRPDLLLTDTGVALTEIDSVPGGIGLTAWLAKKYSQAGEAPIVGGARGMIEGFASLFPRGADIVISQESSDYLPEVRWLAGQLGKGFNVAAAETYRARGRDVYRFFELFDLGNVAHWPELQHAATAGKIRIQAPLKPWMEEKMWLALFWSHPLREIWRQELRENHRNELAKVIPRSWIVDPAPLPHQAVIPGLDINDWRELAQFSQKQRGLVLKLSGFHERAWGSRSVTIGQDVSQQDWAAAVNAAIASFPAHPYILQEFQRTALVRHPYFDRETGNVREMEGRVRLCPYYFIPPGAGKILLGGILATIVPADKKIIHGMKDGILTPVCVRDER